MYATDAIGDALGATREFLLPVDRVTWLRLAVVMFFVGGGGGGVGNVTQAANFVPSDEGGQVGGGTQFALSDATRPLRTGEVPATPAQVSDPELTGGLAVFLGAVVLALLLVVLALRAVGGVMEFVLYASLRDGEVRLRRYFRANVSPGLRLFGFRLAVGAVTLAVLAAAFFGPLVLADGPDPARWTDGGVFLALAVTLVVGIPASLVSTLVTGFTTQFVAPVMLHQDRTLLDAWRRFWTTLTAEPAEYGGYVLLAFVLHLVAGFARGLANLLVLVVVSIPFGVLALVSFALGLAFAPFFLLLVVVGILWFVVLLVARLLVETPFRVYFRYYALLVLGDTDPDLDLIPDARRRVRAES